METSPAEANRMRLIINELTRCRDNVVPELGHDPQGAKLIVRFVHDKLAEVHAITRGWPKAS